MRGWLATAAVVALVLAVAACGGAQGGDSNQGVDATPEKLDGSSSGEFENEDIERANTASEAVEEYCSGAESEAQEVGCLSHVDESDIP